MNLTSQRAARGPGCRCLPHSLPSDLPLQTGRTFSQLSLSQSEWLFPETSHCFSSRQLGYLQTFPVHAAYTSIACAHIHTCESGACRGQKGGVLAGPGARGNCELPATHGCWKPNWVLCQSSENFKPLGHLSHSFWSVYCLFGVCFSERVCVAQASLNSPSCAASVTPRSPEGS